MIPLTRRDFLRLCGTSSIGLALAACGVTPTPTTVPAPTNTPLPTNSPLPSATATLTNTPAPTITATATLPLPTATPTFLSEALLKDRIDQRVIPFMRERRVTGMSIVVVLPGRDGQLLQKKINYGTISKENSTPVSSSTIFMFGSQTKVFTAVLLACAVTEGRVRLDDPVEKYLPANVKVPSFKGSQITLQDLASHRAGFPRGQGELRTVQAWYDWLSNFELSRAPGSQYEYTNLGFDLLGIVLERLYGTTFEELVIRKITEPLQMPDTRLNLSQEQMSRFAVGYTAIGDLVSGVRRHDTRAASGGSGALASTTDDMGKFLLANIEPPHSLIGLALEETQKVLSYTSGRKTGLAWEMTLSVAFDWPVIWKSGGGWGFNAWMGFVKEKRIGLEIMVNQERDMEQWASDVLKLICQ